MFNPDAYKDRLSEAGWVIELGISVCPTNRGCARPSGIVLWFAKKHDVTVVVGTKWVRVACRGNHWDARTPRPTVDEGHLFLPGDANKNWTAEETELRNLL